MYELRDYNIWKEGDTYMVRIKDTGETTPVSQEVVRVLWATENHESFLIKKDAKNKVTSFDILDEDGCGLEEILTNDGDRDVEEIVIRAMLRDEHKTWLTEQQKTIYDLYLTDGYSFDEVARMMNVSSTTVKRGMRLIRKKFIKNSQLYGS